MGVPSWIPSGIALIYLAVAWFGLIDGVVEWANRRRRAPLGWVALVVAPLAVSFEAVWPVFFAAACAAAAGYHGLKGRLKHQDDPEALLLFFCSDASIAACGAVAGLMSALFLFTAGMLDQWEAWSAGKLFHLIWVPAAWGALFGVARKRIRRRWPEPLWTGNAGQPVVGVTTPQGAAIARPFSSGGIWLDEVVLSLAATPLLWGLLSSVHPMWNLLFLYGWIVLPSLVIYMFWAAAHTAWLRWAGAIDRTDRYLFAAYEVLMTDDHVQQWIGELSLDYDAGAHRFVVRGAVPRSHLLSSIRTRLSAIDGAGVDLAGVDVVPDLMPNARLELALSRRQRQR